MLFRSGRYISLVQDGDDLVPPGDVVVCLELQTSAFLDLLTKASEEESLALHPPYTWTLRQVVGHVIDAERIFGCRALRIARNDQTPLPSFDENAYVENADFNRVPMTKLLEEFHLVRRSHVAMFLQFRPEDWPRRGTVSGQPMSARAMAWVIAGHAQHHLQIARRRLGVD